MSYYNLPETIAPHVMSYLPPELQTVAPSAYRAMQYTNGYLPEPIPKNHTIPSNYPQWYQNLLAKVGYSNPDSMLNQVRDSANGARKGFKDLGFDKQANAVLGTLNTISSLYNGYQQNKMAKRQMAQAERESERNWQAQRKMVNSQLEDRQKRRVEEAKANGRTTASVADYMARYGV